MDGKITAKDYLLLYTSFIIFSASSIMNKLASRYTLFSFRFLLFYGLSLSVLLLYAFLWQKVLRRFDLAVAYANRSVVTLLGMAWGILLFHEALTWKMVLGAVIILFGVRIVGAEHGA